MTYSIVARDPETGELGVAVQTALPGVGRLCPWAEAGVGAVATQSLVRVSHGPSGLALMRNGHTATEALAAVLAGDERREVRQIGMIDVNGVVDSHTGTGCIRFAGHRVGDNYAVQANMMAKDTVPDAMAEAYEDAEGRLVERMVAALRAAQIAGGDFRGQQSAALRIVSSELPKNDWQGVLYDVRVDDHPTPVEELARICTRSRVYHELGRAYELLGEGRFEDALAEFERITALDPEEKQVRFSFALEMATQHNQLEPVAYILRELFAEDRMWVEYFERMADARFGGTDDVRQQIMNLVP
jgi:uncharacterized Ntn-hydrolase superfamily protein